jgi:hypothetical protein
MPPRKKTKFSHSATQKESTPIFHGYEITLDPSWIPRGYTSAAAVAKMERSISRHNPADFLWVTDLIEERGQKDPTFRLPKTRPTSQDRGCNSFMQYRMIAKDLFPRGQQTEVSKSVEPLWSTESPEMRFFCERAAEIESGNPNGGYS